MPVEMRLLGRTGVRVSNLCLGAMTYGRRTEPKDAYAMVDRAIERGVNCEQMPYNLLDRRVERGLIPMAQTYGVATIPWGPLAGGMLTGKYTRGEDPPPGTRFAEERNQVSARFHQGIFDVIDGLQSIADDRGVALSQFALAWVMAQPGVTSPIIGPRTMEQLEDNLDAADYTLTEEDCRAVDAVIPPGRMVSPYYEANFGPHPYRL